MCNYRKRSGKQCPEPALSSSKELYCLFHERVKNEEQMEECMKEFRNRILHLNQNDFEGWVLGKINLSWETISSDVDFSDSIFLEDVNFENSKFKGSTSFNNATFQNMAQFRKAVFVNSVDFERSKFIGPADFMWSSFLNAAFFRYAIFSDFVNFKNSTIEQSVLRD